MGAGRTILYWMLWAAMRTRFDYGVILLVVLFAFAADQGWLK